MNRRQRKIPVTRLCLDVLRAEVKHTGRSVNERVGGGTVVGIVGFG